MYIRTGQIFDYDPRFELVTKEEKEKILAKRIDIHNVEDFEIVCTTWSYMFVDLLHEFGIHAKVIPAPRGFHQNVVITLSNGEKMSADMMLGLQDLSSIKIGQKIICNSFLNRKLNEQFRKIDKVIHYDQGISVDEVLEMIKNEIENSNLNEDEKLDKYFEAISYIINFPRKYSIGYSSGNNLIYDLLKELTKLSYSSCNPCTFYNLEENIFIDVYSIELSDKVIYYAYEKNANGLYEFHKIDEDKIDFYLEQYQSKNESSLKRTKKNIYKVS